MKTLLLPLLLLTSCTCMFRGSFLNVDEFSFGLVPHGKTEIIKETITEDSDDATQKR